MSTTTTTTTEIGNVLTNANKIVGDISKGLNPIPKSPEQELTEVFTNATAIVRGINGSLNSIKNTPLTPQQELKEVLKKANDIITKLNTPVLTNPLSPGSNQLGSNANTPITAQQFQDLMNYIKSISSLPLKKTLDKGVELHIKDDGKYELKIIDKNNLQAPPKKGILPEEDRSKIAEAISLLKGGKKNTRKQKK